MSIVMPAGAIRLSSPMTFYYKRVFPVLCFVFPALVLAIMFSADWGPQGMPVVAWAVPLLVGAVGYLIFTLLASDLVDEVWDNGADLLVVNDGHVEPIALANIADVSYMWFANPKRLTLTLDKPGRWGKVLVFSPAVNLRNFIDYPLVDELRRRVEAAHKAD